MSLQKAQRLDQGLNPDLYLADNHSTYYTRKFLCLCEAVIESCSCITDSVQFVQLI